MVAPVSRSERAASISVVDRTVSDANVADRASRVAGPASDAPRRTLTFGPRGGTLSTEGTAVGEGTRAS
jgi:hypothetical protein